MRREVEAQRSAREPNKVRETVGKQPVLEFLRALWALNHALERTSRRMELVVGLTAQQRFVVRLIGQLPGISPGRLAELLHVDRGSITAVLKRLEARDLLVRTVDTADRRRVFLSLSPRGRRFDAPAPVSVEHAVVQALERSTATDVAAVKRLLARLVAALDEVSATADDKPSKRADRHARVMKRRAAK
jgi:DNA-binding MarR family transcriptional regulator